MLLNLHVKNMALIQEEEVEFGPGLNILTGETGAGKSIVIGSVNVALGTGSFRDFVPEGAEYALVELTFEAENKAVLQKLEQMGIPSEDGQIVISRKYQKGRSISRVNGETVNISFIRDLASDLIDIHGQHEHQSLLYPRFHLNLLDEFIGEKLKKQKKEYRQAYEEHRRLLDELQRVHIDEAERAKQIDFLTYEVGEIDAAGLSGGEDEQLEKSYAKLSNGQKILEALAEASGLVSGDGGVRDQMGRAVRSLSYVADCDEALGDLCRELSEVENLANDFARNLSGYMDDFSYDEQEFHRLTERLDLINHLKSKYGKTIDDIFAYQREKRERLDQLTDYEAYLADLKAKETVAKKKLCALAEELSAIRKQHAKGLEEKIRVSLVELNFLEVRFSIDFRKMEEPGANGQDEICFLISTNPGMPLRPLQEVASGGELSRIMLAIKAVMAQEDAIGTLIFDEIDTGISGRTAQKVSEKMAVIARDHQVICITHLAQIAAMADTHMAIEKRTSNGRTFTSVRLLKQEESVEELARILGGVEITDAVYQNAREMKELAEKTKKY